jgi:hypothetical protein
VYNVGQLVPPKKKASKKKRKETPCTHPSIIYILQQKENASRSIKSQDEIAGSSDGEGSEATSVLADRGSGLGGGGGGGGG